MTFDESAAGGRAGPGDIFELSDDYVIETAALDPMAATFWGIAGHDHRMTDYSPEGWAGRLELQHRTMRQLEQLAPRSRNDRIAIDVMYERVGAERDLIESGEYHHWLCSMNSHYEFIHEIFDEFNEPWEKEIVTGGVEVVNGYIEVSERPGLGIDLNIDEIMKHPYQQENYLPLFKPGWERRRAQSAV